MEIIVEWRATHVSDYEVSSTGLVRSWKPYRNFAPVPTQPRLLSRAIDRDGYFKVVLQEGKTRHTYRVCRLVAKTFLGDKEGVVRHLDGNNQNDSISNLVWGTPKENSLDSKNHGTWAHGTKVNTAKLTEKNVKYILKSKEGHSALGRKYGVTPGAIWHIRAGRTWKHIGAKLSN